MTHHRRGADGTRRTPRQALQHFRETGQMENAAILERLLERPRPVDEVRQRRERQFSPDVVDYLEAIDRRREAALRLLPLCCPFSAHQHTYGCRDPLAATG